MSVQVPARNSQRTSPDPSSSNVSPNHPYYKGIVNKQQLHRPRSFSLRTMQTESISSQLEIKSPHVETDERFTVESIDSEDSSSSFLHQEETFSLSQHPSIRPNRLYRRDSNISLESDIFHEVSQFTSTPLGCPETPDWSLASSGYAMGSPSLICSISSSLPPSPASMLKNTFFEMAGLPRRSSLSRLSSRSDILPRPHFKNEQDFRLAGYQLKQSAIIEEKPVKSHFRFSLNSYSNSNK